MVMAQTGTGQDPRRTTVEAAREKKARRLARTHLLDFISYTYPQYQIHWHHRELAMMLEAVAAGKEDRVMIFMPPRHGKSEQVSIRFPALYLGWNPQKAIILSSYALSLAYTFSRACRDLVMSPPYRRLFPNIQMKSEGATHWQLAGKIDERNSMIAAGAGTGITGEGADLFIIDDPFKNYEEASSQVTRDIVWFWYTTTARTRLAPGAAVLLTMTRWHEDDIAGRLIRLSQEEPDADQWTVMELPSENIGEFPARIWHTTNKEAVVKSFPEYRALWPQRYSEQYLRSSRVTMGTRMYSALYGCQPSPATGNIIHRHWFRRWYVTQDWVDAGNAIPRDGTGMRPGYSFDECTLLPDSFDQVCQSWDMAFKGSSESDFVSGGVWARKGADFIMLDRLCRKMNFPETRQAVTNLSHKWPNAYHKYVEDKANGPAIISDLKGKIDGLIPVEPIGSKEARLSAASAPCESNNIVLPHPAIAPWIYDFIECLCVFPQGVHDDDCDMFSQAIFKLRTSGGGVIGLWKEMYETQQRNAKAPAEDNLAQAQKKDDMPTIPRPVSSGKPPQVGKKLTEACPACGSIGLRRYSEGYWECACGNKGRDPITPVQVGNYMGAPR